MAIEPGIRNWNWTEVRAGLEEGEHIVVSLDADELADGASAIARDP